MASQEAASAWVAAIAACRQIALVEHQVEHREDFVDPLRQVGISWQLVGNPGVDDLALGAYDPLGDSRLACDKGAGNLGSGQAGHRAQRQCQLRLPGEGRVATGEDQAQPVVALCRVHIHDLPLQQRQFGAVAGIAPHLVDRLTPRRGEEPGSRLFRNPGFWPVFDRLHEGVLDQFLGEVEISERRNQRRGEPAGLLAENRRDRGIGRGYLSRCGGTRSARPPAEPRPRRRSARPWPSRAPHRGPPR